jgi:hypothetical protein
VGVRTSKRIKRDGVKLRNMSGKQVPKTPLRDRRPKQTSRKLKANGKAVDTPGLGTRY